MPNQRGIVPLVLGIILVVLGGLFLAINIYGVDLEWLQVIRLAVPALLLWLGLTKLFRHFTWDVAALQQNPGKASLLGGVFWGTVGLLGLLDFFGVLAFFSFFGSYWPGLLILFGIGKIIDFYRFSGALQFRGWEVVGVLLLMLFGFVSGKIGELSSGFRAFADLPGPWVFGDHAPQARARIEKRHELDAAGVKVVQVTNRFGDIALESGLEERIDVSLTVVVRGQSEARANEIGRDIQLSVQRDGDVVKITSTRGNLQNRDYPLSTHFRILVPRQAQVTIDNENGSVTLRGINAGVQISNSYGPLTIESVNGSTAAKNRYATTAVRNVTGDVTVESRRGQVRLEGISGNVKVSTDYETIRAERIEGRLEVANHFGQIHVREIQGPLTINGSGSGVDIENIVKPVFIENSHKAVRVAGLADTLELDTSYGSANLSRINGAVTVRASHSEIKARDLKSGISVQGSGSRVALSQIEGPVKIATSLQRVALEKFHGPAEVQNEYGEIVMAPQTPLGGALVASNRNGEITLTLPEDVSCRLSAQAPGGEVVSEFDQAGRAEKSPMFEQTIGDGKNEIRLQTTYSRIRIRRSN
ncbi:MAG TPA: DUF4097 family beta strand repeat-containing protein [Acidobacteriota bacterium]|nr:DUF4097 family beta strand repeat-containing protein [Acidobacteriota bacterium]